MFSELPKLFSRNFAVGFALPSAIFLLVLSLLMDYVGIVDLPSVIQTSSSLDPLLGATVIGLITWILGVILLAFNLQIYHFAEGYGSFNPLRVLRFLELRKYRRLKWRITQLANKSKLSISEQANLDSLLLIQAKTFPDQEQLILSTAFGNAVRAFEVYSRVMYGFEGVEGWCRLQAVVPKDYLQLIDDDKTFTDLWINLWILSLGFLFVFVYLAFQANYPELLPLGGVVVFAMAVFERRATTAAISWGEMVKSAFDVFLPLLFKALGYDSQMPRETLRTHLTSYSEAILYRVPFKIPDPVSERHQVD